MPSEKKKKPDLLPCPFCEGKAVYIFDDGAYWNKGVACKRCELNIYFFKKGWNVSSGRVGAGLEDKIAIAECWNRRANTMVQKITAHNTRSPKRAKPRIGRA